jgi:HEAT repeat protein
MTTSDHTADDAAGLFALALRAAQRGDADARWAQIAELHRRGTEDAFQTASTWCTSADALQRAIAADVLGQLGGSGAANKFRDRSTPLLVALLRDGDAGVLASAATAMGHLGLPCGPSPIVSLASHPSSGVRYGVAFALLGSEDPAAISALVALSRDDDADVRDWATFGLGTQVDLDSGEIRDALAARLHDLDDDARAEAIYGLARRHDERARDLMLAELGSASVGRLIVEAVREFPSAVFVHPLLALRSWWDVDAALLEDAIRRCLAAVDKNPA